MCTWIVASDQMYRSSNFITIIIIQWNSGFVSRWGEQFRQRKVSFNRKRLFTVCRWIQFRDFWQAQWTRIVYRRFVILTFPIEMVFGMLARSRRILLPLHGTAFVMTQSAVEAEDSQTDTNIVLRELCYSKNPISVFLTLHHTRGALNNSESIIKVEEKATTIFFVDKFNYSLQRERVTNRIYDNIRSYTRWSIYIKLQ